MPVNELYLTEEQYQDGTQAQEDAFCFLANSKERKQKAKHSRGKKNREIWLIVHEVSEHCVLKHEKEQTLENPLEP